MIVGHSIRLPLPRKLAVTKNEIQILDFQNEIDDLERNKPKVSEYNKKKDINVMELNHVNQAKSAERQELISSEFERDRQSGCSVPPHEQKLMENLSQLVFQRRVLTHRTYMWCMLHERRTSIGSCLFAGRATSPWSLSPSKQTLSEHDTDDGICGTFSSPMPKTRRQTAARSQTVRKD